MTHEPECPAHWGVGEPTDPCTFCAIARAAYQRGREDAAKAVDSLDATQKVNDDGWRMFDACMKCGVPDAAYDVAIDDAVAAARGDGERSE